MQVAPKLHSKRVNIETTLETSEYQNYTRNDWISKLHSKRVNIKTTLKTSEYQNYTQNEWISKLHSKRVNMWTCSHSHKSQSFHSLMHSWAISSALKTHSKRVKKTHSKRVKKYTQNEWKILFQLSNVVTHPFSSSFFTTMLLQNYTRNEWRLKLHSKRVGKGKPYENLEIVHLQKRTRMLYMTHV